jgi:hypothetical protein
MRSGRGAAASSADDDSGDFGYEEYERLNEELQAQHHAFGSDEHLFHHEADEAEIQLPHLRELHVGAADFNRNLLYNYELLIETQKAMIHKQHALIHSAAAASGTPPAEFLTLLGDMHTLLDEMYTAVRSVQ